MCMFGLKTCFKMLILLYAPKVRDLLDLYDFKF